jgi:hypothetical protein
MLYAASREAAVHAVQALALGVIAERLENGDEVDPRLIDAFFVAA